MDTAHPPFIGVYLFVRDIEASSAFYRRLGVAIESYGDNFRRGETPGGAFIELGTAAMTRGYDPGWQEPVGPSLNSLQFSFPSRAAVDDIFRELTDAGYRAHLAPIDAFWGSRYAIVDDPDGNVVGLHSPRDEAMQSAPPVA